VTAYRRETVHAIPAITRTQVRQDLDLHLVPDNYAARKTPAINDWLVRHPQLRLPRA
jgi:hypothetical protein